MRSDLSILYCPCLLYTSHRSPCVAYRYIIIGGILTFFGSPKQQLKVHHIINDDRALPFILVMVPRADNAGFGFEPGGKCACRLQQNFFVAFVLRQAITVSKAAIHLEAHVVSAAVHLFLFQDIGMLLRLDVYKRQSLCRSGKALGNRTKSIRLFAGRNLSTLWYG